MKDSKGVFNVFILMLMNSIEIHEYIILNLRQSRSMSTFKK